MKKIFACVLALFMALSLGACIDGNKKSADGIKIVSTIFPAYDWVREILGGKTDGVDLSLLVKNGVDLHSYQPSAQDIVTISDCDVFLYVGGESDGWVKDALAAAPNKERVEIDLLQVLDGDAEADEHVWLSLKNAEILCAYIEQALAALCPEQAEEYAANLNAYTEKLDALDGKYRQAAESALTDTLVFGDRFPFGYLFQDYGIACHAAFIGCSAESEVSFDTVISLAQKLDTLDLGYILVSETSDQTLAQTIIENTTEKNQSILVLDSMQSVTEERMDTGVTYFSVMEDNFDVLRTTLQ